MVFCYVTATKTVAYLRLVQMSDYLSNYQYVNSKRSKTTSRFYKSAHFIN